VTKTFTNYLVAHMPEITVSGSAVMPDGAFGIVFEGELTPDYTTLVLDQGVCNRALHYGFRSAVVAYLKEDKVGSTRPLHVLPCL
jgi:hypothetical protein